MARPIQYIVFTADVQTQQAAKLRAAITQAANAHREIYLIISSVDDVLASVKCWSCASSTRAPDQEWFRRKNLCRLLSSVRT